VPMSLAFAGVASRAAAVIGESGGEEHADVAAVVSSRTSEVREVLIDMLENRADSLRGSSRMRSEVDLREPGVIVPIELIRRGTAGGASFSSRVTGGDSGMEEMMD
jgi:hypothetical protein